MTSVDTGWINDEKPLIIASRVATEDNFQTPLDEVPCRRVPLCVSPALWLECTPVGDDLCPFVVCCQEDAAARVLDPIIAPVAAQQRGESVVPPFGVFLKDYKETEW